MSISSHLLNQCIPTSPLNPYVEMFERSSNLLSLLVVKRSQTIAMSSFFTKKNYIVL